MNIVANALHPDGTPRNGLLTRCPLLILGPLHVLWHLPYFFIPEWGTPRDTILEVSSYVLSGIALTFIYTWLFNRTKGSVLLPILAHTSVDVFNPSRILSRARSTRCK